MKPELEKIAKQIFHDYCIVSDKGLLANEKPTPFYNFVTGQLQKRNIPQHEINDIAREVDIKFEKLGWCEIRRFGMICWTRFNPSDRFRLAIWRASRH